MSARRALTLTALLAVLLAACGGDSGGAIAWRDAELAVPEGWTVFEEQESRLSLANVPLGAGLAEEDRPEGDVVAMFFTHQPDAAPGAWREYAEGRDVDVEVDEAIEVGGVPATRFQFLDRAGGSGDTVTRELVVVVPSREVVLLAQPVPTLGDEDVSGVYDRAVDTFDQVLDSVIWGAPVERPGT